MKLFTEVRDIDGKIVASAGTEVTPSFLKGVAVRGAPSQGKYVALNKPFFLNDIKKIMNEKIYRPIFRSQRTQRQILAVAKRARLQSSLYREIIPLKTKSPYNYRHFILIGALSAKLAIDFKGFGYDPQKAFVYGLVHDIGKTRIPECILNKHNPLTAREYRILHTHPLKSLILLTYYLGSKGKEAGRVGVGHHEKLDGSGYPQKAKTMSKYTRLVTIIDIFDALVANRPYRKRPFSVRGALDRLIVDAADGKLPKLPVRLLCSYFRRGRQDFRTMKISMIPRESEPRGSMYGKISS